MIPRQRAVHQFFVDIFIWVVSCLVDIAAGSRYRMLMKVSMQAATL